MQLTREGSKRDDPGIEGLWAGTQRKTAPAGQALAPTARPPPVASADVVSAKTGRIDGVLLLVFTQHAWLISLVVEGVQSGPRTLRAQWREDDHYWPTDAWSERELTMNEDHAALVALLRTRPDGFNWRKLTEEVLECGSARAAWEYHNPSALIPSPQAEAAVKDAAADLDAWERDGLQFLSVLDKEFPHRLLDILETPPFLFAKGTVVANDPGFSVVGSRKASPRGLEMATNIAKFLVSEGLAVISGLAAGIDAAAHTAALDEGGRAVAFIATGCKQSYSAQNAELQAAVVENGLVLSQFWPDAPPQKQNFLMRNALMSGYGLATVVVEAGETSGARAQARMAVEHGRPVILTEPVVRRNEWAKELAGRPGVHVVAGWREIGPIVRQIRSEPERTDEALRQLAYQ